MLDAALVAQIEAMASLKYPKRVDCPASKGATVWVQKDTVITDTEFVGTFGKGGPPAAVKQTGGNLIIQRCGFFGMPNDDLKLRDNATVEDTHLGPQYAGATGQPHWDGISIDVVNGLIAIRRVLIDRTKAGNPRGINNAVRIEAAKGDPVSNGTVLVEDMVIHSDNFPSKLFSALHKRNFKPNVMLRRVGIRGIKASPKLLARLFQPGTHLKECDLWDMDGGGPIPVPPNVTVG